MKTIVYLILVLFLCFPAYSQSSIWLIEKNGAKVYIGGSIHTLRGADYPLPTEFDKAFDDSQIVVLETILDDVNKQNMAKELIGLTLYPKDKTLQTTLSEKVYAELKETCDACEIPIERFHGYKPIMLMLTLFRVKMHEFGVNTAGVDKYYLNKVKDTGKTVLALESNEEQLHLLANMGNDSDEDFVRYYLKYLNYFDEKFIEMIVAWRNGEPELILKQIDDYKLNFPPIYNSLLVDRNKKWIPQIEHYFETKETEFVIVGAMHLHGEDGVLQLMKNKGYKVEQL